VESDGRPTIEAPQLVQIANNPYAVPDEPAPPGTRPRLDTGVLEVDVVAYKDLAGMRELIAAAARGSPAEARCYSSWTGTTVRVSSKTGTVRAGVDGEAVEFPSPVEVSIRPKALRIRVPRQRPGPKRGWPVIDRHVARQLWHISRGRPAAKA
jgi:diacylglycerol kinase family enzyme